MKKKKEQSENVVMETETRKAYAYRSSHTYWDKDEAMRSNFGDRANITFGDLGRAFIDRFKDNLEELNDTELLTLFCHYNLLMEMNRWNLYWATKHNEKISILIEKYQESVIELERIESAMTARGLDFKRRAEFEE